ncbi:MAG: DUF1761 domain-containing protein [Myxococcales bacterium]|nr:DUF1761 domain-containing protein [Myxococcales bacterium]
MEYVSQINVLAVVVSIIAGQILSTLWFTVLFGDPWAQEYGAESRQQHTAEVPGYTYGVQLLCTVALTLSLAVLHRMVGIEGVAGGLGIGLFVAVGFAMATILPGQAFLKRWRVAAIAGGSQVAMILAISTILAAWP